MEQWLFESYQVAEHLYAEAEKSSDFDYRYHLEHAQLLKQRLQQAGMRLASVLNEVLRQGAAATILANFAPHAHLLRP